MSTADEPRRVPATDGNSGWKTRIIVTLVALVAAFVLWKFGTAYAPRKWAHVVGSQSGGSMLRGSLWGIFYGFVFSIIPLLVLAQTRRAFLKWPAKIGVAVVAVVFAIPNLLTASIVWGSSKAAHAGERILDVEAPGFRSGTVIGLIVGVVAAGALVFLSFNRARLKKQLGQARADLNVALKRGDGDESGS